MIRPPARPLTLAASALALTLAAALSACAPTTGASPMIPPVAAQPIEYVRDVHSHARPEIARVVHVDLDLDADFQAKTLSGRATLDVTAEPGANEIVLDVRNLDIGEVVDAEGRPLRYVVGNDDPILGRPMTVYFPAFAPNERRRITIRYATRPDAAALQWLTPAQTAGGQKPYLFSQGQAILTRTWVPTQDSPGIRQTYSARITAPDDLKVVMSADQLTPQGEAAGPGKRAWRFRMDNPIPPYLMAIGIGDLAFAPIDHRTGVFTEPGELAASARELQPTARMVDAAEALYGPYQWGRYDLLVLPPSFPFGGMENPKLTFATPTIMAGDQSLVSLVAHELAHSWSGNLVTNAVWADFWLNEGFTTYFENRIMEAVYGRDRALQEQVLSWGEMQDALASMPAADTRLHLNLDGRDPDDGMNAIAYDKGAAFLRTIEGVVGRERFDAWLRGYFERNAYRPMTSALFLTDIRDNLVRGDQAMETALKLDEWVYQPGLPSNAVAPVSDAFAPVDAAALAFFRDRGPASAIPWSGWNTQQRQRFLNWRPEGLRAGADWLRPAQLTDLESTLNLANEGNAELTFGWLQIALAHRYQPAVATAERFLTEQGRRKFVLPLFTTLWAEGDWGRPIARRIYAEARPLYHPVTTGSVDQVVGRP
ncbi:M1 family peptidase [Brevundimonas sp. S30B]|uniref:M1 family metallopeptidase n=1 Tax=unclassified Brevundimonas TaxID=2622653 RepID=UPI00107198BD|nr:MULTISPECIES: M1 family metallopeptidase [unclassified Brevundimonas]QBX37122.1 M1 family peptidase [Brevundimonas sp. MF30-B]TFW04083.1 M1 family peptidase [Brevundimonas sp. S30B]